ncbi:MAG: SPOR domain-containing protein [Dysgonamonadaceae bacterium]|jgi:nucleoid DNA-binding protein|nr:SPOR domain-containing protein [Dysgonamonadaceae bacterium]
MNELISHIEFLLHSHNCVIVPGFGGFVVNYTPARYDGLSVVETPKSELVFNRELTHNDGLLAESYMKTDKVSFDAATLKIKQAVNELHQQLDERKSISAGDLGSFSIDSALRLVYTPGAFIRPELFGLTKATLKPIIQIQPLIKEDDKPVARKVALRNIGIGAAVAAVITAIMFIFPINGEKLNLQTARMLFESGLFGHHANKCANSSPVPLETVNPVVTKTPEAENIIPEAPSSVPETIIPEDSPKYYVVMGVFETVTKAQKVSAMLNADGFSEVHILKRYGRQHIYTASFSNKEEAQAYVKNIRTNHRAYRDAWILKY